MSDLFFNKAAFCVLSTSLVISGLNVVSDAVFSKHYRTSLVEPPFRETRPQIEEQRDYHMLFAAADAAQGKAVSETCLPCHSLEAGGGTIIGPPLFGVMGRDIGSVPGFKYSTGAGSLSKAPGRWDYEKLDRFLDRPKSFAPATAMTFFGLKKLADRINLIAYLRTLTPGEPAPLP